MQHLVASWRRLASAEAIYRGYRVVFPDDLDQRIRGLLQPPTEVEQIDQHLQIGSLVIEHLQHSHWDSEVGLGRHWTTRRGVAETSQGPGWLVVLEARHDGTGINPDHWGTTPLTMETEAEVNLMPGASVEVVGVYLPGAMGIGGRDNLLARPLRATAGITDSREEWDAAATSGLRWVYHATTRDNYERFTSSGVRMSEVPMNLNRQRYQRYLNGDIEALEDVFYSPGAGVGMGMYVGGSVQAVSGFGYYVLALLVPESALVRPPEANGATDPIDWFLGNSLGMLLVEDVPPDRVVGIGRITRTPPHHHPVDFIRDVQS